MISFSLLLVLAIFFPNPTDFQYFIFRTVIALAAAGVAALIPGLLQIKIPAIQAGGALSSHHKLPLRNKPIKFVWGMAAVTHAGAVPTLHSTVITTKA
jgi:hypothetical protein